LRGFFLWIILLTTVTKASKKGIIRIIIDVVILLLTNMESVAMDNPAAIAPNPHITFDGCQVYGTSPKLAPAVITATVA
jgi:hypothetical protein